MKQTYQHIKEKLSANESLLYRNREQSEGAFVLCSLWAVEFLAQGGGTLEEAQELFERILSYTNDVGLLSEEVDPFSGRMLGNFPLAFSHLGIINSAIAIDRRKCIEETKNLERCQV
jgi:GH15 family glucan-1,4-alpha-glucosidase